MVTHSTITDPEIHEPKGVAEAAANTVYRADGAGSGTWEAPLKLIERRALTGATSEEFTGLGNYRYLILAIESVTLSTPEYLLAQYSTASTYRTSGYLNTFVGGTSNSTNAITTGNIVGIPTPSGYSVVEISNFNQAAPTSLQGMCSADTLNRISSAATDTGSRCYELMGFYGTAEAHEKLKIVGSGGATMSGGFFTLYGIQ